MVHVVVAMETRRQRLAVRIRSAQATDAEVLESLFKEFFDWQLERADSIRKAICDPNAELLVAEADGELVAFIHQVFFQDPLHAGLNSIITNLFVREKHRRRGIASALIAKTIENARARAVQEIHVTTRSDNTQAIDFYKKLGFHKEGILLEMNP